MSDKLAVILLGEQNSGKSSIWEALFEKNIVKTGIYERPLSLKEDYTGEEILLDGKNFVDVFIINGSSEERKQPIQERIPEELPRIVLCSVQYTTDCLPTLRFFEDNEYTLKVIWLNPGSGDQRSYYDSEGIASYLLGRNAELTLLPGGKGPDDDNSQTIAWAIREKVLGWATYQL